MEQLTSYKKLLFVILAIFVIFGIYELIVYLFFDQGTLEVTAKPTEIKIQVKKKEFTTPFSVRLHKGEYIIVANAEGFLEQQAKVKITPSKTTKIYFNMLTNQVVEPTHFKVPQEVNNLPVVKDHFRIDWTWDNNTLTIVPKIDYGDVNPEEFLQNNWSTYEAYGKEALQWLEENGLGEKVRQESSIEIEWWLREFWPEGTDVNL